MEVTSTEIHGAPFSTSPPPRPRVSVVGRFTAPRSGTGGASHASLCGIACGWFYWPLLRGAWMERAVVPGVQE